MIRVQPVLGVTAVLFAAIACGSGGTDTPGASGAPGTSTSSSSGGSSGSGGGGTDPGSCDEGCLDGATIAFDESNADGRLEGALIEACHRDVCAKGPLVARDAGGPPFQAALTGPDDAGRPNVSITAEPAASLGTLRFRAHWSLGVPHPAARDGDVFTISARVSEDGSELFARSFPAVYADVSKCGNTCKVFTVAP